ncbi:MAG: lysylphosphatidylglycerol synthase transmembrane domain-containing protein [Myxococcota bacterium]
MVRWLVRVAGALAVSALALGFAFHGVELSALWAELTTADPAVVALYAFGQVVIHGLRTVRWGLLVRPLGEVSWRSIFTAASIGLPATFFLPLRLGEFVRPGMIARSGVPFSSGLASVVVERTADGLMNVALFFAMFALLPADLPSEVKQASWAALVFFTLGLAGLVFGYFARDVFLRVTGRLLGLVSRDLAEKVTALLRTFLEGLRGLGSGSRIAAFIGLTLLYWGVVGFTTQSVITSMAGPTDWTAGLFSVSVVVFAIMIPAGPAFAGTMEAGFRVGLRPYGIDVGTAAAVAVVVHLLQLLSFAAIAGVGFLFAAPGTRPGASKKTDQRPAALSTSDPGA